MINYHTSRKHISNKQGNTRSSDAANHFRPNKRSAGMTYILRQQKKKSISMNELFCELHTFSLI